MFLLENWNEVPNFQVFRALKHCANPENDQFKTSLRHLHGFQVYLGMHAENLC